MMTQCVLVQLTDSAAENWRMEVKLHGTFSPFVKRILLFVSDCPHMYTREEWGARDPSSGPSYIPDNV